MEQKLRLAHSPGQNIQAELTSTKHYTKHSASALGPENCAKHSDGTKQSATGPTLPPVLEGTRGASGYTLRKRSC